MDELGTPVRAVMSDDLRTVPGACSVAEAANTLLAEGIGSVVVEAASGAGVVTKTDVVRATREGVDPEETPVTVVMSTPPVTVPADADLQTAVDRMADEGLKRLLVVDGEEPVGMVTTTDVVAELSPDLDAIVDMFAE